MRSAGVAAVACLLLVACPDDPSQRAPEAADDGIQLTGTLGGSQAHVSDGEPEVVLGDCDPNDGIDRDLCISTFTIDGAPLTLVVEDPDRLAGGTRVAVVHPGGLDCLPHCDDVTGGAVVELRRGVERRHVRSGHMTVREWGPRYAVAFLLRTDGGRVSGSFNVRPRGW
ncbi:MAG TPA: hypothetical protein VHF25_06960 [Nitriliruptorales bacterium]|nr:hypothetical protein [Nitriliruptorales bacterium]